MKKLLLVCCFISLLAGSAAAQPVTLTGIGTVDLPPNVIVTPRPELAMTLVLDRIPNTPSYTLRSKDGAVWRGLTIKKDTPLAPDEADYKKSQAQIFLENSTPKEFKPTPAPDVLAEEPAQKLTLNGKDCVHASGTWDRQGVIFHIEVFKVAEPAGVKLFMFTCADGDFSYWHPFMLKIVGATP